MGWKDALHIQDRRRRRAEIVVDRPGRTDGDTVNQHQEVRRRSAIRVGAEVGKSKGRTPFGRLFLSPGNITA